MVEISGVLTNSEFPVRLVQTLRVVQGIMIQPF